MIRVAIADDSPFTCNLLASYIAAGGDCEVVGVAHDAPSTLELIRRASPDVLTLDLQMPGSDGLELLGQLGAEVSVVVISGVTRSAAATTLRALELGAVDFVLKYTPGAPVSRASLRREIVSKVKIAAAAKAPTRVSARAPAAPSTTATPTTRTPMRVASKTELGGLVIIGASTGGPRAVGDVLSQLPPDFDLPCIVVQHLPATFTQEFAMQMSRYTRLSVKVAETGDRVEAGVVLVAPGSMHLTVRGDGRIQLQSPVAADIYRPSINLAMTSAAETFGSAVVGVLLTGAGDDGAEGLKAIGDAGGERYVQEPSTCIVSSMPERALERGGAARVASPERIGQFLAVRSKP